mgnify:CR=1 FL=1
MLRQVGAIPFAIRETEPLVLMITSRTHERWIFPKGAVEEGETAAEAALREAYEVAGCWTSLRTKFRQSNKCLMVHAI